MVFQKFLIALLQSKFLRAFSQNSHIPGRWTRIKIEPDVFPSTQRYGLDRGSGLFIGIGVDDNFVVSLIALSVSNPLGSHHLFIIFWCKLNEGSMAFTWFLFQQCFGRRVDWFQRPHPWLDRRKSSQVERQSIVWDKGRLHLFDHDLVATNTPVFYLFPGHVATDSKIIDWFALLQGIGDKTWSFRGNSIRFCFFGTNKSHQTQNQYQRHNDGKPEGT
mmetsp:Transcript_19441/g.48438  ORF Transcript_19441/g.48438 Transcript_19441/m.48438 type:complete len:218 (-) Transcript_19441:154-807(-)